MTQACLDAATDLAQRQACIGAASGDCMQSSDGATTVGMGFCLMDELAFWDERLNAAYQTLRGVYQKDDDEAVAGGWTAPPLAPALRDMQRAWIAWRDTTCDFEARQWGGGSGGGPAHAGCMMRLTGLQALYLEDWISEP